MQRLYKLSPDIAGVAYAAGMLDENRPLTTGF